MIFQSNFELNGFGFGHQILPYFKLNFSIEKPPFVHSSGEEDFHAHS